MTILNLMLGRKRGGLEQAAFDYAEALVHAAIPALTVLSPHAWIEPSLVTARIAHQSLANHGYWDFFAARRLRRLVEKIEARAVICHGNRALGLALLAVKGRVPIIAVAHNYSTRRFSRADHCFAITTHLANYLKAGGAKQISIIPNMVRLPPLPLRLPYRTPPVIGAMGRLETKKGFDVYIQALAILKERGIAFKALLGGEGSQAVALQQLIHHCGLADDVTMTGWVQDKAAFFESMDLCVLPSRHEAFGIVLIEAMAYGVPVIASDAEGPSEILQHIREASLIPRNDPVALAEAITRLLNDEPSALALAQAGRHCVETHYTRDAMAQRLQQALATYGVSHG